MMDTDGVAVLAQAAAHLDKEARIGALRSLGRGLSTAAKWLNPFQKAYKPAVKGVRALKARPAVTAVKGVKASPGSPAVKAVRGREARPARPKVDAIPEVPGATPAGRLGRLALLYGGGEAALTGGEQALGALGATSPMQGLDVQGQRLRGYGQEYQSPTGGFWGGGTSAGGAGLHSILPALQRPTKSLMALLTGAGGEGSALGYSGGTATVGTPKDEAIFDPRTGQTTRKRETVTQDKPLLTPKGKYLLDERRHAQGIVGKRDQELKRLITAFTDKPEEQTPPAAYSGHDLKEWQSRQLDRYKKQRESGDFGGDWPERSGKKLPPSAWGSPSTWGTEAGERDPNYEWGVPGKSQLQYRQQIKDLEDQLRLNPQTRRAAGLGQLAALSEQDKAPGPYPLRSFSDVGEDHYRQGRRRPRNPDQPD